MLSKTENFSKNFFIRKMNCVGIQKDLHLFLISYPKKIKKEIELVKRNDKNNVKCEKKNLKKNSFWNLLKNSGFEYE